MQDRYNTHVKKERENLNGLKNHHIHKTQSLNYVCKIEFTQEVQLRPVLEPCSILYYYLILTVLHSHRHAVVLSTAAPSQLTDPHPQLQPVSSLGIALTW
jgi:hypothetical protein